MTSYLFQSCIALKFPDKMEINISVPEDYDIEKLEILVDTLRSQAKDKFDRYKYASFSSLDAAIL